MSKIEFISFKEFSKILLIFLLVLLIFLNGCVFVFETYLPFKEFLTRILTQYYFATLYLHTFMWPLPFIPYFINQVFYKSKRIMILNHVWIVSILWTTFAILKGIINSNHVLHIY